MSQENGEPTAETVRKAIKGLIRHVAATVADDLVEKPAEDIEAAQSLSDETEE